MAYLQKIASSSYIPSPEEGNYLREQHANFVGLIQAFEVQLAKLQRVAEPILKKRNATAKQVSRIEKKDGAEKIPESLIDKYNQLENDYEVHEAEAVKLMAERDGHVFARDSCVAATYPVRKLHPDVLQRIILLAIPADDNGFVETSSDVLQAPWNVAQVCRLWRDTAFRCPHLWSFIGFQRLLIPDGWWYLLRCQLGRSRQAPLSLSITTEKPAAKPTDIQYSLLDTLFTNFSRCARVLLILNPHSLRNIVQFRPDFAQLRDLILFSTGTPEELHESFCGLLKTARNVTSVRTNHGVLSRYLPFPTNLVLFDVCGYIDDIIRGLPSMPSVETLSINTVGNGMPVDIEATIPLHRLKHFSFGGPGIEHVLNAIDVAPELECVSVALNEVTDMEPFRDFVVRSRCSIRSLEFTGVQKGEDITRMLATLGLVAFTVEEVTVKVAPVDTEHNAHPSDVTSNLLHRDILTGLPRLKLMHVINRFKDVLDEDVASICAECQLPDGTVRISHEPRS